MPNKKQLAISKDRALIGPALFIFRPSCQGGEQTVLTSEA